MNSKKSLVLFVFFAALSAVIEGQTSPEYKVLFEKAKFTMETKGDLNAAINLFNDIIKKYPKEREYAAKSQLYIGLCYEKLGVKEANKAYESVVKNYADQSECVKTARERLKALASRTELTAKTTEVAMRRIWSPGEDLIRAITPDGKYAIFEMYDNGDLWLHDLQSGDEKQITREGSIIEYTFATGSVAVSPDCSQIAYGWWIKNHHELRLSNLDGSSMRVLHQGKEGRDMSVSAWMPDGHQLLAMSYDQKDQKYRRHIISLPDGLIRDVGKAESEKVNWGYPSQDGKYIAYNLRNDIYIYDTVTELDSVCVRNPAIDAMVGWTPDRSGFLFISNRSGTRDLYLLNIQNGRPSGEPEVIRRNLISYSAFGPTSDGRLFHIENTGGYKSYKVAVNGQTGKIVTNPSLINPDNPEVFYPSWSFDGKFLYYYYQKGSSENRSRVLVLHNEETDQKREIIPVLDFWWYRPLLSPDNRKFAVTGEDKKDNFGIFAIGSDNGSVSQLVKVSGGAETVDPCPNWSPDGTAIFYKLRSPEKSEEFIIRKKDLNTGEEKDIYRGFNAQEMKISPDGTRFVYYRSDRSTNSFVYGILDIETGKELVLWLVPEAEAAGGISSFFWAPDGRYVFVARNLKKGSELWRFPATGGTGERIHFFPEESWGFTMHPGGKQMAFTLDRMNYELWVLENFLPKEKIQPNNQLTLKKLDYPHLDTPFARLSPDGKKLAYAVYSGNLPKRIDILDIESGKEKVLVESGAGSYSDFVWSPQCDKIAYISGGKELHVRNIDGSDSRLLLKDSFQVIYPTDWSRDGEIIVCFFEGDDQRVRIGTVTSKGEAKFLISGNSTEFPSEPKISPDGKFIAFSQGFIGGNTDIFILTTDGNEKIKLTAHPGRDENPVWSPDGGYLLFLSDRNRSVDLWCSMMKNGKPVGTPFIVKNDIGWRTRIYDFTASGKLFLLMLGGAEPANLFTIPVDQMSGNLNGSITPISVYPTDHYFPRYSPDGKKIAYLSRKGQIGMPKLFVINEEGAEQELPLQGHDVVNVAWHPGNQSLIFAGWDKEYNAGIFEVSLEKEEIKTIYSGEKVDLRAQKGGLGNLLFLADIGKLMFFRGMGKGNMDVITCDPDGQNMSVALSGLKTNYWSLPSPTGEHICYRTGDSLMIISVLDRKSRYIGTYTPRLEATWSPNSESLMFREGPRLKIFSLRGNISRTLYEAPAWKTIGGMEIYAPAWSPDGNSFIFTERDTSAISTSLQKLFLINPGNGSVKQLGETPDGYQLSELRWSPDGSKVVATGRSLISTGAPLYEYWILENFLPK